MASINKNTPEFTQDTRICKPRVTRATRTEAAPPAKLRPRVDSILSPPPSSIDGEQQSDTNASRHENLSHVYVWDATAPTPPPSPSLLSIDGTGSNLKTFRIPHLSREDAKSIEALAERCERMMGDSLAHNVPPQVTEDVQSSGKLEVHPHVDVTLISPEGEMITHPVYYCWHVASTDMLILPQSLLSEMGGNLDPDELKGELKASRVDHDRLPDEFKTSKDEHEETVVALTSDLEIVEGGRNALFERLATSKAKHDENLKAAWQDVYDMLELRDKAWDREKTALRTRDVARQERDKLREELRTSEERHEAVIRALQDEVLMVKKERYLAVEERAKLEHKLNTSKMEQEFMSGNLRDQLVTLEKERKKAVEGKDRAVEGLRASKAEQDRVVQDLQVQLETTRQERDEALEQRDLATEEKKGALKAVSTSKAEVAVAKKEMQILAQQLSEGEDLVLRIKEERSYAKMQLEIYVDVGEKVVADFEAKVAELDARIEFQRELRKKHEETIVDIGKKNAELVEKLKSKENELGGTYPSGENSQDEGMLNSVIILPALVIGELPRSGWSTVHWRAQETYPILEAMYQKDKPSPGRLDAVAQEEACKSWTESMRLPGIFGGRRKNEAILPRWESGRGS